MKLLRIFNHNTIQAFFATAVSLLLLSSCADDFIDNIFRTPLLLSAGVEKTVTPTRAATNIQGSVFDKDETIAVYIKDTDGQAILDGHDTPHCPANFVTSAPDQTTLLNVLTFSPQLYFPLENKPINIRAYYPSSVTDEDELFTVKYNQGDERDYKNSDLMYAEKLNQGRTSEIVNLQFNHKLVKFIFNVEGDGSSVTVGSPYLTQIKRTIGFNPSTGELTDLTNGTENRGDVVLDNGGAIIIPPQNISGNFIGIEMTSERDGEIRTGTATFSLQSAKELKSGKVYTVNIVLGHDNLPEAGQSYTYPITKWDDDAGVISIAPAGTTGIGVATPDDVTYTGQEFVPTPEVRFGKNRVLTLGTDYDLQYFNNVHGGKAIVLVVGKGDYLGFSVATSFTISPATSTLTYESDAENWHEGQEQGKVSMKYTYNGKVDNQLTTNTNGEVSIAYNSDNGNVATVNSETGEVTVRGVGTATITADIAATSDWTAAHAEYELTVVGRSAEESGSEISVDLDYHGQTYVYDGTTRWEPGVTVKDTYTEDGETKETVIPSDYYNVEYPDPVSANEAAEVLITFVPGVPYTGTITKHYNIAKANSNIQISKISDMYIALPTNTNITEANRTRTLTRAFGTVRFSQPTGSESIAAVSVTNNSVTITGLSEGDFELTLYVDENESTNWNGSSQTIHVYVKQSEYPFEYTGYSQRWKCPATGTYLLEVWGGQGGSLQQAKGGYGAKVQGTISLTKDQYLYVNVGQKGPVASSGYCPYSNPSNTNPSPGQAEYLRIPFKAWNGGGALVWGLSHSVSSGVTWWVVGDPITGGGGATDISLLWKDYNATTETSNTNWNTAEHLLTRIIVAGGGGGSHYYQRETGTANGTSGGAWEAGTMTITGNMTDPGEGGKIDRGGLAGVATVDRSTYASQTTPYDSRPCGWSGSDGIFGDGGYWYCVEEGGGAGGGGWYGGGSCGQSSANGSGAGGSSYAWTDGVTIRNKKLSEYYPKASDLANTTYYSIYNGSSVQNPNQNARGFSKLTNCSATADANGTDDASQSLDGKAKITCISIVD